MYLYICNILAIFLMIAGKNYKYNISLRLTHIFYGILKCNFQCALLFSNYETLITQSYSVHNSIAQKFRYNVFGSSAQGLKRKVRMSANLHSHVKHGVLFQAHIVMEEFSFAVLIWGLSTTNWDLPWLLAFCLYKD